MMKQFFDAVARDKTQRALLDSLFSHAVRQEFRGRRRGQLVAYMSEDIGGRCDISGMQWKETEEAAVSYCWGLLYDLDRNEKLKAVIEEALADLDEGNCTFEDMAQRVCPEAVRCLAHRVAEQQRDKCFAGLRQAIARRTEAGSPAFFTRFQPGLGSCFSPQPEADEPPSLPQEAIAEPPAALGAPDAAIRKSQTVTTSKASARQLVWDSNVVAREARRFWQAFVDKHNNGKPCLVPIHAMYCWLCKYLPLVDSPAMSLDAPFTDNSSDMKPGRDTGGEYADPNHPAVETLAAQAEAGTLAGDFVNSLPRLEVQICAWYFALEMPMENVARALGMAGPSSISRHKAHLLDRLQERVTQFDDATARFFVLAVQEECKKRCPAPTDTAEVH